MFIRIFLMPEDYLAHLIDVTVYIKTNDCDFYLGDSISAPVKNNWENGELSWSLMVC